MASHQATENRGHERALVLVKALPHPGRKNDETVCCAGVTPEGHWRRQYPIHFRQVGVPFKRWDWIEYDWATPSDDPRPESRRVQDNTVKISGKLAEGERAAFMNRISVDSTAAAAAAGRTLALIRPVTSRFSWVRKPVEQVEKERLANEKAAKQTSLFGQDIVAMVPCPYEFKFAYTTADGKAHNSTCGDWETSATFARFRRQYGETGALNRMGTIFNEEYPTKGMMFAMGTHSRWPGSWLLVGVIRVDAVAQPDLGI